MVSWSLERPIQFITSGDWAVGSSFISLEVCKHYILPVTVGLLTSSAQSAVAGERHADVTYGAQ